MKKAIFPEHEKLLEKYMNHLLEREKKGEITYMTRASTISIIRRWLRQAREKGIKDLSKAFTVIDAGVQRSKIRNFLDFVGVNTPEVIRETREKLSELSVELEKDKKQTEPIPVQNPENIIINPQAVNKTSLDALIEKPITIFLLDGKTIKGELVGIISTVPPLLRIKVFENDNNNNVYLNKIRKKKDEKEMVIPISSVIYISFPQGLLR